MVKKETKMPLPKIYLDDDLFSTQEQRDDKLKEKAFRSLAMKGFSYSNIKRAWSIVFEDD